MVNGINTQDFNCVNLGNRNNLITNPFNSDKNIFSSSWDYSSGYKYDEEKVYNEELNYKTPREEYEEVQLQQGAISKFIDNVKIKFVIFSLLGMVNSLEVEDKLENYESGNIREYEARDAIIKYKKNQKILKDFLLNIMTIILIVSGFVILKNFEINLGGIMSISCMIGGIFRIILEKLEFLTASFIPTQTKVPAKVYQEI